MARSLAQSDKTTTVGRMAAPPGKRPGFNVRNLTRPAHELSPSLSSGPNRPLLILSPPVSDALSDLDDPVAPVGAPGRS